ncbi:MFS transporter [Arthrobacter crystallopoietes]|uniref:Predicted arabinose efflux permease, MFS family n=1 Tax=Crystallibacter crystallopoietes TaxID=37928 RepID=A0A1H1ERQ2_9MICC|nr:MFS transporter [Arthrobacter crystallopoietes]AUI49827.1 MFS transporter [Arthrobacter crystallopoietes]SDQ90786.1 Predicted arabinose efflux permease, MFS family [Arthrobacter crystallopoietes]
MRPEESFSLRRIAVPAYGPSLLYGVGQGAILPIVALSARDLGATVALAALMVTLLGVGSLVTNIPASMLTARFGEKRALVAASLWCAAAMFLAVVAPNITVFALAVFLIGMGGSVFLLARQSYLSEAVPIHFRARALSTLGGVHRIGMFIGPFAGAVIIGLAGTAGAYWLGAGAFLVAAGISLTVPELEVARTDRDGEGPARPSMRSIARSHRRIYLTIGIGILLIGAVRASRNVVIPLWGDSIGLDAATTSVIFGLSGAVDMLVFYPAGKLMDLKGRLAVAIPFLIIMSGALFLIPFTTTMLGFLLAALLIGLGNGLGSGIVMTLGADYAPPVGRAQFLGFWRLLSDTGIMGGPALLSLVTATVSLSAGIWVTAGLGLLGAAAMAYWIPRTGPLEPEPVISGGTGS